MSTKIIEKCFTVSRPTDALFCSIEAKTLASEVGFPRRGQWEIAIAVKELVTNAVAHAGGGRLTIRVCDEGTAGVEASINFEVEVEDNGPGIQDLDKAILDGYSRGRFVNGENFDIRREGLGAGLGTVKRLMDSLQLENKTAGGLLVRASKLLVRQRAGDQPGGIDPQQ